MPQREAKAVGQITTPVIMFPAQRNEGTGRKRGPVPKRRFQKGSFQVQNGKAYTLFYKDVENLDGTITTECARHLIGDLSVMSERAARREHDLFMAEINRRRGSVPVPIKGETFQDAVNAWKKDVAPQLSPATVRQRESYLRIHVLPVFAKESPHALDVQALQRFATSLQNDLSSKTIINVLETISPHAQSTFRRVPINFRRTERAAPALPQLVGERCNLFARVFSLHFSSLLDARRESTGLPITPAICLRASNPH
jgi:Phage integrase, N-terminal SAM-like domain